MALKTQRCLEESNNLLSKIICYYWNKSKISDVQVKTNTYYNVIRTKALILAKNKNKLRTKPDLLSFFFFFFYQGFLSRTLTIHRTAREGRGPSFIPLYHFHPLMNIETFICNLEERWLSRIFNCNACV